MNTLSHCISSKIQWITLILTFALPLFGAQSDLINNHDYYSMQLSIENGLSQASVNSILCDHNGTLWIGTKSGLNRFDYYEHKNYFHEKGNPSSLPGNKIFFLVEDSSAGMWVSTDQGLAKYDAINDRFLSIGASPQFKAYSFLSLPKGMLFGGRDELYFYSYQSRKLKRLPIHLQKKGGTVVFDFMLLFDANRVLVGSKKSGLWWYHLPSTQLTRANFYKEQTCFSIFKDSTGRLYVSPYKKGLLVYNKSGELMDHITAQNSHLNNDIILDIKERNGKLWLATDGGGINILNLNNLRDISYLMHVQGDANSLPVNSITCLYWYHDNLWAGSVRGGAFGIKDVFIKTYKDVPLYSPNGLSDKTVISLCEDHEGLLWIGTDGGGINCYYPQTRTFKHYPIAYSGKVVSITEYTDTQLLVSFYSDGLFLFDKQTGKYQRFTIINPKINKAECEGRYLTMACKVAPDRIYILSSRPYYYTMSDHSFTRVRYSKEHLPYVDGMIVTCSDRHFTYLIKQNKLFKIAHNKDSIVQFCSVNHEEDIRVACKDSHGKFWLGTSDGLKWFDPQTKRIQKIETPLFNNVLTMVIDNKDRLWIGAHNMLFTYVIQENRFVLWNESDGFTPNELMQMYPVTSASGDVFIGGSSGLVKIDKNISIEEVPDQKFDVMSVVVNGKSEMPEKEEISIPYDYSSLTVKVKTNTKDILQRRLYRYQIEGYSKQVIETYSYSINIPLLPPGDYAVLVSFNAPGGGWSQPHEILSMHITPPWYKSNLTVWGGTFLFIILLYMLVFFFIRRKENRLKWTLKEHEQEVYEEKIKFLINISHELRTPLTLIYAPLKRLIKEKKETFSYENNLLQLNNIYKQALRMKNIINLILEINKIKTEQSILRKQVVALNEWVTSITDDFKNEMQARQIQLCYELNPALAEVTIDKNKCEMVLSNFLINAIKFSSEGGIIKIRSEQIEDKVRISIIDQGIGLKNADIDKLFTRFYQGNHDRNGSGIGLSYAKELIELHGGTVGAYNNPDNIGATFFFDLPQTEATISTPVLKEKKPVSLTLTDENRSDSVSLFSLQAYSILIVEDESDLRHFLKDTLKEIFKSVYTAENGQNALEITREKLPDIIVSDVMMPFMDGFEMCKILKDDLCISHIPVVLLTARSDQESTAIGYKLGADAYLSKPFDTEFLLILLQNLLKNRESVKARYKSENPIKTLKELTTSNADETFMIKLNETILKHLDNTELNIPLLINALCLSKATLYNKVKALTGMTVNDYIIKIRIEKAAQLLAETNLTITEISDNVGFAYQRYFSTQFKLQKGVTPSQFRQQSKEDTSTFTEA
ncbi:MAG: two-component regulator propeller domain-containing protein [Bacteroides sp.]